MCNEYPPGKHGGIGTLTQSIARAMVARGHQVSVVGSIRQNSLAPAATTGST
ncbi:MAG: hypothetical protein U0Y68_02325 [Blastocatellia bacterium]